MTKKRWIRGAVWAAIAATTLFIWSRSLQSAAVSFEQSESVNQLLVILFGEGIVGSRWHMYIRKAAHLVEFALLGMEWGVARRWLAARVRWVALAAGPAVAVCDELLQHLSAGRSPQVTDVVIDCVGYAAGMLLAAGAGYLLTRIRNKKRRP